MGCSYFPSLWRENLAGSGSAEAASGDFRVATFCTCPWWQLLGAPIWVYAEDKGCWAQQLLPAEWHQGAQGQVSSWRHRPKGKPKKAPGKCLLNIRGKTTFALRMMCTRTGCLEGMWTFCSWKWSEFSPNSTWSHLGMDQVTPRSLATKITPWI